jgi:hypothetical protein
MREISFFEGRLCLAVQLQKNRNFYLVVPFCFFGTCLSVNAQVDPYTYFLFSAGVNVQNIKSKSLNRFENNYKNYHGTNIKNSRNYPGTGFYIQANLSPLPLLNMEISRHNSHKQINFKDGGSLNFKLTKRLFRFNMGVNLGEFEDQGFIIKPEFSVGFGNSIVNIKSELKTLKIKTMN